MVTMEMVTKKTLRKWQKRLGLDDWKIILRTNVHPNDMKLEGCSGTSDWRECGKTAVIQILGAQYYGERIVPFDQEKTLVHEILHLKFTFLETHGENDTQDRIVHQLIDDLARALVEAERSGEK